jgi:hypothetical protein
MKKLTHFATALANNTLSMSAMTLVKGGTDNQTGNNQAGNTQTGNQMPDITNISNMTEDEKRRQRPGGGISTN